MRAPTARLCKAIDHEFSDEGLLERALTHRSSGGVNNERLEFLGDAILGFVIAEELYRRFPKASEGQLSRLRSMVVKRDPLAARARALELGRYLKMGAGELRSGGQARASILADALEAVFGAVFIDGGYPAARRLIRTIFSERLERLDPEAQQKDPKTRLQEYLQARRLPLPVYEVESVSGDQHEQLFAVRCALSELQVEERGVGASRRNAEQEAAERILRALPDG